MALQMTFAQQAIYKSLFISMLRLLVTSVFMIFFGFLTKMGYKGEVIGLIVITTGNNR